MFSQDILYSKSISNGCVVFLEKITPRLDTWSTQVTHKYRVFIKDYSNEAGHMYGLRTTDSLLEAHVFFTDLCK